MSNSHKLIYHCIVVGVVTVFIGIVTEKTLERYNRKDNFLSRLKQNYILFILCLFTFGAFMHYVFEYTGFEAYCHKKCNESGDKCEYVCNVKFNL